MLPRFATLVTLVLAAAACGGGGGGGGAAATPAPSASNAGPAPSLNVFVNANAGANACPRWIVLSTSRTTYRDDELRSMADFFAQPTVWGDASPAPPPPTLQWSTVTIADPTAPIGRYWNDAFCALRLQVTNTGGSTVQIPAAGLRLTSPSRANDDRYHLVEACSVIGSKQYCGIQKGGGPTFCDLYRVDVTLSSGAGGRDYTGTPSGKQRDGSPCPEITLAPGGSVEMILRVSSAEALAYPVEPVVVVRTGAGTQPVAVASSASLLKFAAPSQFDCARRSGQSLTVAWSGPAALDWDVLSNQGAFCG